MKQFTIKIKRVTKNKIKRLANYNKETYDQIINRILKRVEETNGND